MTTDNATRVVMRPRLVNIIAAFALMLTSACDRDSKAALRSHLDQWFFIRDTAYFTSRARCTGAMFYLSVDRPRPALAVQNDPEMAKQALTAHGIAALQITGRTPAELTDILLLAGQGGFGKQALAASAVARSATRAEPNPGRGGPPGG